MEDFISTQMHVEDGRGHSLLNRKMIFRILGILLYLEGMMFLVCTLVSLFYNESDYIYFVYSMLINFGVGSILFFFGKNADKRLSRRDGYCIVAFTWLFFTLFGMLPFYISGSIPSVTDAFFETMSGFTTTGASILDNIESLSHGMLFWRSFTQWIGGLGIVFFTIAILPIFGVGNQVLFSAEATGVNHDKIHPKISKMAKGLWMVYLVLTVVEAVLLWFGGMGVFDAVCHSFTSTATGGFSTKQSSVAYWNSPFIEYVITIFTMLSAINYSLYFLILKGKTFRWFKDAETRFFLISVGVVTAIITFALYFIKGYGLELAFRRAFFQVVTIHTSCGYATDDYSTWPHFTLILIVYIMFAGGCTGSTAGGMKSMRLLIILQNVKNEFNRLMHPRAVLPVKVNGQSVSTSTISTVTTFAMLYLICTFVGWFIFMVIGLEMTEAMGIAVSSIGNVGPGFGSFGPAFSWSALPDAAKWVSSFLMLIGRLELFGILLMFAPSFWEKR
ncbi:TrkH family potassium uptake protein [Bacteroides caecigallinarum]|uniref:TrkH family potassium uptake protein n=1 Tax=Bacteroides caecigallinarum TaxID=1411144 RepID=UPI001F28603D|nr:TrkH family potassium uptake protein [Bacteroides caecigallinarum]MCF2738512.1 TrkH family potassium uptake protein [Bacteroides caecigallinarum]